LVASLRSIEVVFPHQVHILVIDRDNDGSGSSSSGPGSGDLSDYEKHRQDKIPRNELFFNCLGFAPAKNEVRTRK